MLPLLVSFFGSFLAATFPPYSHLSSLFSLLSSTLRLFDSSTPRLLFSLSHHRYSYGLPYFENILINATVGQNAPGLIKAALATAFSSIVFDLPYIWIYGTTSGLLSGLYSSWDEAAAASNKGTYGAWKDGLKVWPGFTFLSMYFLPRDLVVPAGNMIGYFWNTYFMLMQSRGSK